MLDQNQPYRLLLLAFRSFQLRALRCGLSPEVDDLRLSTFRDLRDLRIQYYGVAYSCLPIEMA